MTFEEARRFGSPSGHRVRRMEAPGHPRHPTKDLGHEAHAGRGALDVEDGIRPHVLDRIAPEWKGRHEQAAFVANRVLKHRQASRSEPLNPSKRSKELWTMTTSPS